MKNAEQGMVLEAECGEREDEGGAIHETKR
jgi:hypothetical protein